MARYIITGGCGFIGSLLTKRLLARGDEIIVVDDLSNGNIINQESTLIKKDITELDNIHKLFNGIDGCFHLAAKPAVNMDFSSWFKFHQTNLDGSLNVFKSAIDAGNVPVVYASTCGVYGDNNTFPLTEDQFLKPLSSYGCDKFSSELNAAFLSHTFKLPSMGLRLFNVYGPYQNPASPYSGVITNFITQLLAGAPLTIYGDGEQTRDFVFVEDIVANLIHAMDILKHEAIVSNICTGVTTTINELAYLLADLLQVKCVINYQQARQYDARESYGSTKKMATYGFKINYDLSQGLSKTIDYFKSKLTA